ncbi:hypothetical protein ACIBG5_03275 [Kribbella sp. NPDC050241]|uniref:hypothetical protein n=1 Tax=Kribbella sp. NPDC050241 TaxID=3364115 RepID=UPI0037B314B0
MRYVMVEHAGQERPGVLDEDSILLLEAKDLTAVIETGACRRGRTSLTPKLPQMFLQEGDVVVTRADKIGELRNTVVRQVL